MSDYDAIIGEQYRSRMGLNHHTFAVRQCMSMLKAYRAENGLSERFDYVFEAGTKGHGEIMNEFSRVSRNPGVQRAFGLMPDGYSFQPKSKLVQLQAPDILAWESYRHMLNSVVPRKGPAPPQRQSFRELVRNGHVKASFFHSPSLLKLLEKMKEADAARASNDS